jgi:glycosyltransferase involved in cell wall biosynthesis
LSSIARPGSGRRAARNRGARQTSGEILVFEDVDVVVHADAFERIRRAYSDDETLTALFGSYDDQPTAGGLVSDFRNLLHHHVHEQAEGPATTFWAGLGAIRREAFLRFGEFDDQRFPRPSIEDIELARESSNKGGGSSSTRESKGSTSSAGRSRRW